MMIDISPMILYGEIELPQKMHGTGEILTTAKRYLNILVFGNDATYPSRITLFASRTLPHQHCCRFGLGHGHATKERYQQTIL